MGSEPTTLFESITDVLITEPLETIWWARVKCGYLTQAASRKPQSQIAPDSIAHNCNAKSH